MMKNFAKLFTWFNSILSNTCWESRVKSMKVVRYQTPQIKQALLELLEISDDAKTKSEVESLANELENFEFLFGMKFCLVLTWLAKCCNLKICILMLP